MFGSNISPIPRLEGNANPWAEPPGKWYQVVFGVFLIIFSVSYQVDIFFGAIFPETRANLYRKIKDAIISNENVCTADEEATDQLACSNSLQETIEDITFCDVTTTGQTLQLDEHE